MASRVASKSSKWLADPATYPLLACISFGAVLCASVATRHLTSSPDVKWNREKRKNPELVWSENQNSWSSHRQSIKGMAQNRVNTHNK